MWAAIFILFFFLLEGHGGCLLVSPYHFTLRHPAHCPALVIHKVPPLRVLTNDSTDSDYHSEPLPDPTALLFLCQPTEPSLASQLVIRL